MRNYHRHHRKLRVHCTPEERESNANIMLVTPAQHHWIHNNVAKSYELGYLVKSWQKPSEVPIKGPWPFEESAA